MRSAIGALALAAGVAAAHRAPAASPPTQTYLFMVFSDPIPGREAAYEAWNTDDGLVQMASLPGLASAQRYVYSDTQMRNPVLKLPRHMALLTVKSADPVATTADIKHRTLVGRDGAPSPINPPLIVAYRVFRPAMVGTAETAQPKGPAAARYVEIVFQNPMGGQDDAFNAWYDKAHAPELLAVPGWVGLQRAVFSGVDQAAPMDWPRYLAAFRLESRDLSKSFNSAMGGGPPSPALDRATAFGYAYRALGPVVTGDGGGHGKRHATALR